MEQRGVRAFAVWALTWRDIPEVEPWRVLERALFIRFRERFGAPPVAIGKGSAWWPAMRGDYSTKRTLDDVLQHVGDVLAM